jgi:hypothetical protein
MESNRKIVKRAQIMTIIGVKIIFNSKGEEQGNFSSISSYLTFTILKKPDDEEELET